MKIGTLTLVCGLAVWLAVVGFAVYLFRLVVRALRKYSKAQPTAAEAESGGTENED